MPRNSLTLLDALVCLALAWHIHGDATRIRATAKRLIKRVHKHARATVGLILESSNPPLLIETMLKEIDHVQTPLPDRD